MMSTQGGGNDPRVSINAVWGMVPLRVLPARSPILDGISISPQNLEFPLFLPEIAAEMDGECDGPRDRV